MTKLFLIDSPERLRQMSTLVKRGSISSVATVWSAARRRQGGTCAWDGKIMVSFYTSNQSRRAILFRVSAAEETEEFASLKYAPALAWCREHLQQIEVPEHRARV